MVYFADTIGSTSIKQQSNIQQEQSNVRSKSQTSSIQQEQSNVRSKSQTSSIQQTFAGNGEKKTVINKKKTNTQHYRI
jgi:hypothetical protein